MASHLPEVTVIGGGMITQVQVLPSLYQLQRQGHIGDINVCALNGAPLQALADDTSLQEAFPGQTFTPHPDFRTVDPNETFPDLYKDVLAEMPPRNIAFIALPDQLHKPAIMEALNANQHVITVKPLVLSLSDAVEIEEIARKKGLFVGVEYHKRFDDRALMARKEYQAGNFGNFRLGQAVMIEPYYYRNSNFQNWCTCENTDMFTYVGCHYVDQVAFMTGLRPVEVSVYGIVDEYPNGNKGYLWTDGRVIWDNGASLSVVDAIGYPNVAPGGNAQGLKMFNQGDEDACLLFHEDQFRGLKWSLNSNGDEEGDTYYNEPSPDYFKLVYRGGNGLEPVGYGHRSIEALVQSAARVETAGDDLVGRCSILTEIDEEGVIATPANSNYNELVIEAGRLSITNQGRPVVIDYENTPHVRFKDF